MELEQANWLIQMRRTLADSDKGHSEGLRLENWQANLMREQTDLRRRASARFPDSHRWLWTVRSLAQASDWWCARYKSGLFPARKLVVDGCCGAGADLVALSMRGEVIGIDRDPSLVAFSNFNLAEHGLTESAELGELPRAFANLGDSQERWLHLDPDRRAAHSTDRRLRRSEEFSPTLTESLDMARQAKGAILKLAPGTLIEPHIELAVQNELGLMRCWLGNLGECRQQLLLTGEMVHRLPNPIRGELEQSTLRSAVLCEPNAAPLVISGQADENRQGELKPRRFIYDCHAVLHAAQLQMVWAESIGAVPLGTTQGYFTADKANPSAWAQCFEVVDVLPWDQRRVKRWLREHQIGEVEVKKRLLQLDANEQQRRLRGAGESKITLLITRLDNRVRAIVARRI